MNTVKNLKLENEAYEAPKCEIIEIENEGMLCASNVNAGHDGFTEEDFIW